MDQIFFFRKKLVKWQKVLEKFPHRNIYDINNVDQRLTGGADSRINNAFQEENSNIINPNQLCVAIMESGENLELNLNNYQQTPEHTEMDEILKNVIQNIQEASTSLMNLTKTHENDLKTLFATILTKLQQFINDIGERLSITKNALNSLQLKLAVKFMELETKNRELIEIKNELAKCREEASKFISNEPQLPTQISTTSTQTLQTINEPMARISKEAIVNTGSSQKMTILAVSSSHQVKGTESAHEQTARLHSMIVTVESPVEIATNQNNDPPPEVSLQPISNPSTILNTNAVENITHILRPELRPRTSFTSPSENVISHKSNLSIGQTQELTSNRLITKIQDINTVVQADQPPVCIEKPSSYRPSVSCMKSSQPIVSEAKSTSSLSVRQSFKQQIEIENNEKEAQLLTKIEEICRENEQLKKDKLEYEQAIQKALYRGISSLNSEAIKILPNLPLICYQPCYMPCPYLASSSCNMFSELMDGNKYVEAKNNISSKAKTQLKKQPKYLECYRPTKECSQSNMAFILSKEKSHHAYIDIPQFHMNGNNFGAKKTVCHSGSCNREATRVYKHYDSTLSNELCKGNFQEYTEAVGDSNTINSSQIKKAQKLKRTGFAKPKRFINN